MNYLRRYKRFNKLEKGIIINLSKSDMSDFLLEYHNTSFFSCFQINSWAYSISVFQFTSFSINYGL